MDLSLSGKTALVTGSAQGIGFATAQGLANLGATLVLNDLNQERLSRALEKLKLSSIEATGIAADLSTASGAQTEIDKLPKVDILVNNMGIYYPKPFVDASDSEWQRMFDTNVMSGVRLSRPALPARDAREKFGSNYFCFEPSSDQCPGRDHPLPLCGLDSVPVGRVQRVGPSHQGDRGYCKHCDARPYGL